MPITIARLPTRSSPTRRSIFQRFTHAASVHSLGPGPAPPIAAAETMLAKASKSYQANPPPARNPRPHTKHSFPSSSSSASASQDIREQLKGSASAGSGSGAASSARVYSNNQENPVSPLGSLSPNTKQLGIASRERQKSAMASLYGKSDPFQHDSGVIDLTSPTGKAKVKEIIDFAEDDFSDDENLDLDYKPPSALPPLPVATSRTNTKAEMPPAPPSTDTDAKIPWSSSPASHFLPPKPSRTVSGASNASDSSLKRESSLGQESQEAPVAKRAKKRVLPASFRTEEPEGGEAQPFVAKTPAAKSKGFWDPTASAVKEQRRQLKGQRQPHGPKAANTSSVTDMQGAIDAHQSPGQGAICLSDEQNRVIDMVVNKGQSVFFTGPAGAGKSVLMRSIIKELKAKHARDPERVAVTASTGLAACNIGGITLHSFSGIGLGKEDAPELVKKIRRNQKAKNRWLKTKCLIIDEVSMVDGDLFDKLSHIGRVIRNNGRPWGGIQLIITGDFFQLPPVPDHEKSREVKFAFDAKTWSTSIDHTIGLTQVFRQRDPEFARMLNEMRLGKISEDTVRAFKALSRPLSFDDGVDLAELFPTRVQVERSNEERLRQLPGKVHRFDALDMGDPNIKDKLLQNMMAPKSLDLKINAQVMLIKNLDESLVNGSLGKVVRFSDEKTFEMTSVEDYDQDMDSAMAKARKKLKGFSRDSNIDDDSSGQKFPVVQFMATDGTSRTILCQPEEWKVELPNGDVQAKRTQLPLILAWALSIHKAQGQTLERVTVNLGKVFEKGQAYVALSRATTQSGLRVIGFERSKVMAHPKVVGFYNKLYSVDQIIPKRPTTISGFLSDRKGDSQSSVSRGVSVVKLDDDEEAMASYGF